MKRVEPHEAFRKGLDRHGYALQADLGRRAWRMAAIGGSNWCPVTEEFPVATRDSSTRIDLLLEHRQGNRYLVVEAKRANPALAYWCFARLGIEPGDSDRRVFLEMLSWAGGQSNSILVSDFFSSDVYDVAFDAPTGERGDDRAAGRGAIEEAVTQALRGANGLIEFLNENPPPNGQRVSFQPVVVTTADLIVCPTPIPDLPSNGDPPEAGIAGRRWVYLNYPQSPTLRHGIPVLSEKAKTPQGAFEMVFRRSVAIVNAEAFEDFLLNTR